MLHEINKLANRMSRYSRFKAPKGRSFDSPGATRRGYSSDRTGNFYRRQERLSGPRASELEMTARKCMIKRCLNEPAAWHPACWVQVNVSGGVYAVAFDFPGETLAEGVRWPGRQRANRIASAKAGQTEVASAHIRGVCPPRFCAGGLSERPWGFDSSGRAGRPNGGNQAGSESGEVDHYSGWDGDRGAVIGRPELGDKPRW